MKRRKPIKSPAKGNVAPKKPVPVIPVTAPLKRDGIRKADVVTKPRTKAIKVVSVGRNNQLTMARADKVAEMALTGANAKEVAQVTAVSIPTAYRLIRNVRVDADYPENYEEWQDATKTYMQIAIYKAVKRLADTGIDQLAPAQLAVTAAILTDKLAIMNGQPTSVALTLSATLNPQTVLEKLKQANLSRPVPSGVTINVPSEVTTTMPKAGGGGK